MHYSYRITFTGILSNLLCDAALRSVEILREKNNNTTYARARKDKYGYATEKPLAIMRQIEEKRPVQYACKSCLQTDGKR